MLPSAIVPAGSPNTSCSALKRWRMAANIDPEFALAHLFLSYATPDPAGGQTERQKAKFLARDVTPGEQLLIAWFDGVRENDYLPGIAAMVRADSAFVLEPV